MYKHGCTVKMLFMLFSATVVCPPTNAIASSSMPTHLVSVGYGAYPYIRNDDDDDSKTRPLDDTSAQESIKIENRQLYDTVKHASGYDPDEHNNGTRSVGAEPNEKVDSSVKIFIPPRKSAVIQAIPRKVRGPGNISTLTSTSSPFAHPPSLHTTAKDYGTGEPTTTIVYATSIPTPASRTYVNIRPVPLLSAQKYRSTIVTESKQERTHDTSAKPIIENFSEKQQQQQKSSQLNVVLEKPAFKIETNSEQATTTPRSYETTPYLVEQRRRNLYKSIPYARIRTNEDIDEMPAYNRNAFVNPYPNHKWTNEDFIDRMPQPPPTTAQFMYENHQTHQQNYYHPLSGNQNLFTSRYPPSDSYQDEMYRPSTIYMPHQQQQQQQQQQHRQQYQPLTVRDFDLLLQLLVLRERRLHAPQEPPPYTPLGEYNEDSNYYYNTPKVPQVTESPFYKNSREPAMTRNSHSQPSQSSLLPSSIREELLFRMLLLALHLQPQPKPMPRSPPMLPPQYMYLGSSASLQMAPSLQQSSSPTSSTAAAAFLGFRQRNSTPKNPVRSVQVLGEID